MKKPNKIIYLDNASSTPVDGAVLKIMQKTAHDAFANPSGIHKSGLKAKTALEKARKSAAEVLGSRADEIIFVSSGTEANNLAIRGVINNFSRSNFKNSKRFDLARPPHIVTTNIEHSSVLETCRALERGGAAVTYVPVEKNGIVDPKKIRDAIRPNTVLVSVMYANNEIGAIQPIQEIAKTIRHFRKSARHFSADYPLFHTDAVQAANYLPIKVEKLGIDLMTLNGSKIYGPRGIGALWKKRSVAMAPVMTGGDHEHGLRPGTENLPAVLGFAKALEITESMKEKESARLTKLRDYFINELTSPNPLLSKERAKGEVILNGDANMRLPNNVNISVPGIESDLLVIELDASGIEVSSKSACKQDDPDESYVIRAIRPESDMGEGSVRFSLGRSTTKADLDFVIKALKAILSKLKIWYN